MFKQAVLANLLHILSSITYFCYLEITQIPVLLRLLHIRLQTFFRTWVILAYACYCILKVQHNARHINIKWGEYRPLIKEAKTYSVLVSREPLIESYLYLPGSPPLILDISPAIRVPTSQWVQTWILLHSYFYQQTIKAIIENKIKATIDISCFDKMYFVKNFFLIHQVGALTLLLRFNKTEYSGIHKINFTKIPL